MMKKLLFTLFASATLSMSAQTATINIDWGFGSNPSQPTTAANYTNRTIEVGDTVVWTWIDGGGHNVASQAGSTESFASGSPNFTVGTTFSHTFTTIGVNPFVCQPHSGNMNGTITVVAEGSLSTPEFQAPTKFSIFPNPGNDIMNISLPSLSNEALQLEVFDVLGKRVYSEALSDLSTKVNISQWNSGLYLVRLTSSNLDVKLTKRFVKL